MTGRLACPLFDGRWLVAQATQEQHQMVGSCFARVGPDFRMLSTEVFYQSDEPMRSMLRSEAGAQPCAAAPPEAKGRTRHNH